MNQDPRPLVGILMGSDSDLGVMRAAPETLERFGVSHEYRVASAHRTPDLATAYARDAAGRGIEVIIGAAGGAAHLAGVLAAHTQLPVLGVPLVGWALDGLDALLATVQMPKGVPVGTLAIGKAGAINAALLAVRILALSRPELGEKLRRFQEEETRKVMEIELS